MTPVISAGDMVGDEGQYAEDFTTLKWEYREHRDGETARFRAAGFSLLVVDCDGDSSYWTLKHHGKILNEGESVSNVPDHFHVCLQEAEKALRAAVADRRSSLNQDGGKP